MRSQLGHGNVFTFDILSLNDIIVGIISDVDKDEMNWWW
jgi:hypothetical protein